MSVFLFQSGLCPQRQLVGDVADPCIPDRNFRGALQVTAVMKASKLRSQQRMSKSVGPVELTKTVFLTVNLVPCA